MASGEAMIATHARRCNRRLTGRTGPATIRTVQRVGVSLIGSAVLRPMPAPRLPVHPERTSPMTMQTPVRRRFLAAGAGAVATLAAAATQAQPAAPVRKPAGPPVWLDLDQAQLDAAYDQSQYAPNQPLVTKRYAINSAAVRERLGAPQRFGYGPTAIESVDVYPARQANAPVMVFIHGGAWRNGLARDYAFAAELFVEAGVHLVVPDFLWVQDAGGSLMPMADQVRRSLAWVYRNARRFGGDPGRVYVSGHSSGGHLGGVLVTTDWPGRFGLPGDVIKGAVLCSGIYDLRPVRLSARSNYVKFTDEMEQALSPQRHLKHLNAPLVLAYGTLETPEFQRQTRDFAAAVKAAGKPVELLVGEGYNHFEILETLSSPFGLLGRAALAQIRRGTA
jgi:arylformamidase